MAKILNVIPNQNFELIRDRITEIIIDELAYQNDYINYEDDKLASAIFTEHSTPFNEDELPAINVSFAGGDYSNKNVKTVEGTYTYNIDFFIRAESTTDNDGDYLSAVRLQRVMGVVRYILEDPIYRNLGFSYPKISLVKLNTIAIADSKQQDIANINMGRLVLEVRCSETTELLTPNLIAGYETTVKINNTNFGYKF